MWHSGGGHTHCQGVLCADLKTKQKGGRMVNGKSERKCDGKKLLCLLSQGNCPCILVVDIPGGQSSLSSSSSDHHRLSHISKLGLVLLLSCSTAWQDRGATQQDPWVMSSFSPCTFGLLGSAHCLFPATSSAEPELPPPFHVLRVQEAASSSIASTVSSCGTASPVGCLCCVLGQLRTPRKRKTSGGRGPCLGLQPS